MDFQGPNKSAAIIGCLIDILDQLRNDRNSNFDKKGWISEFQAARADVTLLAGDGRVGGDLDDKVQVGLMSRGMAHILGLLFIISENKQDNPSISTIIKTGIKNLEGVVSGFSLDLFKAEMMEQIQLKSKELSQLECSINEELKDKPAKEASRGTGKQTSLMGFATSEFYDYGLRARAEDEKRKLQRDENRLAKADELFHETFFSWLRTTVERKFLAIDIAAMRRILATLIGIIIELVENQRMLFDIEGCIEKLAEISSFEVPATIADASCNAELEGVVSAMQESSRKLAEVEAELEDGALDDDMRRGLIASREHHANDIKEYGHKKILLEERSRLDTRKQEGENNARLLVELLECLQKTLKIADSK